jgi:hypothetical protein
VEQRAKAIRAQQEELDSYIRSLVSSIPESEIRAELNASAATTAENIPFSLLFSPINKKKGAGYIIGKPGTGKTCVVIALAQEKPTLILELDKPALHEGHIRFYPLFKVDSPEIVVLDDVHYLTNELHKRNPEPGNNDIPAENAVLKILEDIAGMAKARNAKLIVVADGSPANCAYVFSEGNRARFLKLVDGCVATIEDAEYFSRYLGKEYQRGGVLDLNKRISAALFAKDYLPPLSVDGGMPERIKNLDWLAFLHKLDGPISVDDIELIADHNALQGNARDFIEALMWVSDALLVREAMRKSSPGQEQYPLPGGMALEEQLRTVESAISRLNRANLINAEHFGRVFEESQRIIPHYDAAQKQRLLTSMANIRGLVKAHFSKRNLMDTAKVAPHDADAAEASVYQFMLALSELKAALLRKDAEGVADNTIDDTISRSITTVRCHAAALRKADDDLFKRSESSVQGSLKFLKDLNLQMEMLLTVNEETETRASEARRTYLKRRVSEDEGKKHMSEFRSLLQFSSEEKEKLTLLFSSTENPIWNAVKMAKEFEQRLREQLSISTDIPLFYFPKYDFKNLKGVHSYKLSEVVGTMLSIDITELTYEDLKRLLLSRDDKTIIREQSSSFERSPIATIRALKIASKMLGGISKESLDRFDWSLSYGVALKERGPEVEEPEQEGGHQGSDGAGGFGATPENLAKLHGLIIQIFNSYYGIDPRKAANYIANATSTGEIIARDIEYQQILDLKRRDLGEAAAHQAAGGAKHLSRR